MADSQRLLTLVVVLASLAVHWPAAARTESPLASDVCALMLRVEAAVSDSAASPIEGAEVWQVERPRLKPPEPTRAELLGRTDRRGRLKIPVCYMGASDWRFWHPATDPVRLEFMILREGYGAERVNVEPNTADVLAAGNVLGVPQASRSSCRASAPTLCGANAATSFG